MKRNKKLIFLALLTAMGLVLGLFESMIPIPVALPGARLGLSNMVVLVTIVVVGAREGIIVALLKTMMLTLVTGSVSAFFFSLGGAILSSLAMIISYRLLSRWISLIGVSEIGSFFHNLGQVLVACFILHSRAILTYLPLLVILGLFTGYFVGLSAIFIGNHLAKMNILEDSK